MSSKRMCGVVAAMTLVAAGLTAAPAAAVEAPSCGDVAKIAPDKGNIALQGCVSTDNGVRGYTVKFTNLGPTPRSFTLDIGDCQASSSGPNTFSWCAQNDDYNVRFQIPNLKGYATIETPPVNLRWAGAVVQADAWNDRPTPQGVGGLWEKIGADSDKLVLPDVKCDVWNWDEQSQPVLQKKWAESFSMDNRSGSSDKKFVEKTTKDSTSSFSHEAEVAITAEASYGAFSASMSAKYKYSMSKEVKISKGLEISYTVKAGQKETGYIGFDQVTSTGDFMRLSSCSGSKPPYLQYELNQTNTAPLASVARCWEVDGADDLHCSDDAA